MQFVVQPYEEGEEVLVDSRCGRILWEAKIIGVSKDETSGMAIGYRVSYKGWGSRFDEWVAPIRVVEQSENNLHVQVCIRFKKNKKLLLNSHTTFH